MILLRRLADYQDKTDHVYRISFSRFVYLFKCHARVLFLDRVNDDECFVGAKILKYLSHWRKVDFYSMNADENVMISHSDFHFITTRVTGNKIKHVDSLVLYTPGLLQFPTSFPVPLLDRHRTPSDVMGLLGLVG